MVLSVSPEFTLSWMHPSWPDTSCHDHYWWFLPEQGYRNRSGLGAGGAHHHRQVVNITDRIVVIVQAKQDGFKFNLELNWGREITDGILKVPLFPIMFVPHCIGIYLLLFPQCETALSKLRSVFPHELSCSGSLIPCLSIIKGIPKSLLFSLPMAPANTGVGTGFWVKSRERFMWGTCSTNTYLGITLSKCRSSDQRALSQ